MDTIPTAVVGTVGRVRLVSANVTRQTSIAIVGAGASGTLLAARVLRSLGQTRAVLRLVDPRPETGRGIAYSTNNWQHRLNVPSGRMSAYPEEPGHFVSWLVSQGEDGNPANFAPRALYGAYLHDCLTQAAEESAAVIERIHEQVVEVEPFGKSYRVRCSGTTRFEADWVVFAVGSPKSDKSWAPWSVLESERFFADAWTALADDRVRQAKSVVLVGAGLTMVDLALTLGKTPPGEVPRKIHSVSRSGLLPTAHRMVPSEPIGSPSLPPGPISLDTVREIVAAQLIRSKEQTGDWRPAIDSMRAVTDDVWQRLSPQDREEFLRTDLRKWDRLRHRMAPQSAATIARLKAEGQLDIRAGEVAELIEHGHSATVVLKSGEQINADVVIDCTGPAQVSEHTGMGAFLLADLVARGLARAHALDTGIDCDGQGRLINAAGHGAERLRVIGPMRKGSLWETTAMPEIRVQAAELATDICRSIARLPKSSRPVDLHGLELSADQAAADAYNDALGRMLRVQSGVEDSLMVALDRDEDFALAHIAMGVLAHEYETNVDAYAHVKRAEEIVAVRGTERERALVQCMAQRIRGDDPDGAGLITYLAQHPRDSLATSVAVPTIAFAGIYKVPSDAWNLVEWLAPHYGQDWWFAGLLAFIRQEQGRWDEAERLCQYALGIEPTAGTAVHARTHVFFETGNHSSGLTWLDEWISTCGRDAVHRAHFSWHAALHELALGDDAAVRRRYERQLAPPMVDGMRALVDSASLLWRWRIEGVRVDPLQTESVLRAIHHEEVVTPKTPFAAMHAAIALALNDDAVGLHRLRAHCEVHPDPTMGLLGAPVVTAFMHYIAGEYAACADTLLSRKSLWSLFAGSDAQREVLLDTAIAALTHAQRYPQAAALLQRRLDLRPRPRDSSALTAVVRRMAQTANG